MSAKRLAWMQVFPSDHIAATRHLTLAQRGALFDLLCLAWATGPLPKEPLRLAAMVGATQRQWNAVWPAIADWWTPTDAGLVSAPLEARREHATKVYQARAEGGRESAKKRGRKRHGHRNGKRHGHRFGQREETTTTTRLRRSEAEACDEGRGSLSGGDEGENRG